MLKPDCYLKERLVNRPVEDKALTKLVILVVG